MATTAKLTTWSQNDCFHFLFCRIAVLLLILLVRVWYGWLCVVPLGGIHSRISFWRQYLPSVFKYWLSFRYVVTLRLVELCLLPIILLNMFCTYNVELPSGFHVTSHVPLLHTHIPALPLFRPLVFSSIMAFHVIWFYFNSGIAISLLLPKPPPVWMSLSFVQFFLLSSFFAIIWNIFRSFLYIPWLAKHVHS